MRSPRHHSFAALTLGFLLLTATATHAVVIFFKDGSQEIIAQSYRIEGDRMIATLQSGQETSIPLEAVDLERTETLGRVAKGSAVVLDQVNPGDDNAQERDRTLRDLVRDRATTTREAEPQRAEARAAARRTPSGNIDYFSLERRPVSSSARAEAIASLLRRKGLRTAEAFQGTQSDRVLVDLVTASRGEVFTALQTCAAILLELRASAPEVEALELTMATSTRSRAGQFVLTAEQAERLAGGALKPADYFVANVLF